jgi:hypothetical protein
VIRAYIVDADRGRSEAYSPHHLFGDGGRRFRWRLAADPQGVAQHMGILVEYRLETAIDRVLDDAEPIGLSLVQPTDEGDHLWKVEEVTNPPRDAPGRQSYFDIPT